jgi:8-amino-7-oxononanoate synthase
VAADRGTIRWLVNQGRAYMFSTALAPGSAAAARAGLRVAHAEPERRGRVLALAERIKSSLAATGRKTPGRSPIVPIIAGDEGRALSWANHCLNRGLLVPGIRHPTVPMGQARLRVSLSAIHADADISGLEEAIASLPGMED